MKFQKLLSLLLVFCMILSSVTAMTLTGVAEAIAVTDTTTKVVSVNDGTNTTEMTLGEFITAAATSDFSGQTLTLLEDISVAGISDSIPNFAGTLDGNGKTISDLSAPLFATLTGATVKNLTLASANAISATLTDSAKYFGVLALQSSGAVILENVVSNVNVNVIAEASTDKVDFYVGGLIGYVGGDLTATGCVNNGNTISSSIIDDEKREGLVTGGLLGSTVADANVKVSLKNCTNNGKVAGNPTNENDDNNIVYTAMTGGLVGSTACLVNLEGCKNYGMVTTDNTVVKVGGGGHKVGGLIGYTSNAKLTITSCANYGDVSSNRHVGGIVGQCINAFEISNTINVGDITVGVAITRNSLSDSQAAGFVGYIDVAQTCSLTSCVNYGAVSAIGISGLSAIRAGGIVAYHGNATTTLVNCANYGAISASTSYGLNNATRVGGAIAHIQSNTVSITNTGFYNAGSVTTEQGHAGGIYGWSDKAAALKIENCYISGTVSAADGKCAGAYGAYMKQAPEIVNCGFANGVVSDNATYFTASNSDAAVTGTPTANVSFKGYQQKLVSADNSALGVRFVAGLDSLDHATVGFEVYAIQSGAAPKLLNKAVTTVYETLYAYSADGELEDTITAEGLECEYLTTIVLTDLPTDSDVTLVVIPYVTDADGDVTYGLSATVEVADGKISY